MSLQKCLLFILLFSLLFPAFLQAQTETTVTGDLLFVKLTDGLNAVLMPIPQTGGTELTCYIKSGSMYESDSTTGISNLLVKVLGNKITNAIKTGKGPVNLQNTTFSAYATTERAVFKFITNSQCANTCLGLLRDSVFSAKITKSELALARNSILQQIEDARHDKKKIFEDKMVKGLYVQDHQKLEVMGTTGQVRNYSPNTITNFLKKYYVPNNSYIVVTGSFNNLTMQEALEANFKALAKSPFNPETVSKIVDLRPMVYNTQFIVEDTAAVPEFQICWQFPGTNNNIQESYCAFLISAMLNDKNNFIQAKAAKMGCKKFTVEYEANNFNGILRVSIQPSKQNLLPTYQFIITELGRLNTTLLNDVMIGAGKLQFKKEYEYLKKSKEYPKWIVDHWTFNDESYFPTLKDSVMNLEDKRLEKFVIDYFNQSPHITGLKISKADRDALKVDSGFTELDQSVARYVFTYRQNITGLEGADNNMKEQNLLQWLIVNPDINVQVNGFSDEHEYNKTTDDDSIVEFLDSMPTFLKVTSEIIKNKRTIRPELARAVKIVKYLYEHGIAAERLNGTAMMFKSNSKEEAIGNMKCTLTLNKVHKSMSLYEYHYGRKKE